MANEKMEAFWKANPKLAAEVEELRKKPDNEIDLSDIPEITDWSGAVVGKFYRPKRKLFVSFTALLRHLKDGSVVQNDLNHGLFYFGCTRSYVFDDIQPKEVEWFFRDDMEAGAAALAQVRGAIVLAEAEGRCIWREAHEMNSYEALNDLLVKNGYSYNRHGGPAIVFENDNRTENPSYAYCYPGVRDRIAEAAIPLEVVM